MNVGAREDGGDAGVDHGAPVWAVFGDLMAGLLGAFVLILVLVIGVQLELASQLDAEVQRRQAEQQRRQALEQALEHRRLTRERNRLLALTARQNADLLALNQSLEQKVQARTEDVRRAFTTSISVLTNLIELRDGAMAGHSRRVAVLARDRKSVV